MRMLSMAALAAAFSFALTAAHAADLALEAELAQTISRPMQAAVPQNAANRGGQKPSDPSNGQFIWAPGAPNKNGGNAGYARFTVPIENKGNYMLFGHAVAWDNRSDTFWVTIWQNGNRKADQDRNPQRSRNRAYQWRIRPKGAAWVWDRIDHRMDAGGRFDRSWELKEGLAVITIWTNENAAMLDALYLTDNPRAKTGKLPTRRDRDLQSRNFDLSVDPKGKIASTWGQMKAR